MAVTDAKSGNMVPTAIVTNRFNPFGRMIKNAHKAHKWDALIIVITMFDIQLLSFVEMGSIMGERRGRVMKSNINVAPF